MFIENNFVFKEIDSALLHLEKYQIVDLVNKYYEGVKNSEILVEYNINVQSSKLVNIFPLVRTNVNCDYCKATMITKLSSKSNSNRLSYKDLHCSQCHHFSNITCDCSNCVEERILKKRIKEQQEKMLDNEKYNFLEKMQCVPRIKEDSLDLKSKLYLSTVLRECLNEEGDRIENFVNKINLISPYRDFTDEILNYLINNSLIIPSLDNDLNNIIKNDDMNYYIYKVKYRLNIEPIDHDYQKLIHRLIYPKTDVFLVDETFCYEIWKKIAFYEAMQYLIFKMESVRYDFNPGVKTITVFENLVEKFSVGQIYNIIYRAIANSTEQYQSGKISKIHAQNMVISSCEGQGERAIANNWNLTNYSRVKDLPQSQISKIFFDSILQISYLGFSEKPTLSL